MAGVVWLQRRLHDVPAGDEWLSARELDVQARLLVPKRRADWRLGRWTAKAALAMVLAVEPEQVSIAAARDVDRHDELTCLLWSVKEASAKVLREGLRLDPRSAAVVLESDEVADELGRRWRRTTVRWPTEDRVVTGWCRLDGSFVDAIAGARLTSVPVELR